MFEACPATETKVKLRTIVVSPSSSVTVTQTTINFQKVFRHWKCPLENGNQGVYLLVHWAPLEAMAQEILLVEFFASRVLCYQSMFPLEVPIMKALPTSAHDVSTIVECPSFLSRLGNRNHSPF